MGPCFNFLFFYKVDLCHNRPWLKLVGLLKNTGTLGVADEGGFAMARKTRQKHFVVQVVHQPSQSTMGNRRPTGPRRVVFFSSPRFEGGPMHRNERYFSKNDGKHNYFGEDDALDKIIDKYQEPKREHEEEPQASYLKYDLEQEN